MEVGIYMIMNELSRLELIIRVIERKHTYPLKGILGKSMLKGLVT